MTSDICVGKRAYATKDEARRRQPKKKAYRCPLCEMYHHRSVRSRRQRA
jgi:hypothetical protein